MEIKVLELTVDIVAAHVGTIQITTEELLSEIDAVHSKLSQLAGIKNEEVVEDQNVPAITFEAAFQQDKVFCMICGRGFKVLSFHLRKAHGISGKEYRKMFGIKRNVPLASGDTSDKRRANALKIGLHNYRK
ncbi:MAG: MucR family transcriptional regulator [Candidatus Heimdallarchaeaceae archaeon]